MLPGSHARSHRQTWHRRPHPRPPVRSAPTHRSRKKQRGKLHIVPAPMRKNAFVRSARQVPFRHKQPIGLPRSSPAPSVLAAIPPESRHKRSATPRLGPIPASSAVAPPGSVRSGFWPLPGCSPRSARCRWFQPQSRLSQTNGSLRSGSARADAHCPPPRSAPVHRGPCRSPMQNRNLRAAPALWQSITPAPFRRTVAAVRRHTASFHAAGRETRLQSGPERLPAKTSYRWPYRATPAAPPPPAGPSVRLRFPAASGAKARQIRQGREIHVPVANRKTSAPVPPPRTPRLARPAAQPAFQPGSLSLPCGIVSAPPADRASQPRPGSRKTPIPYL